jgi:hypothetical protein
MLQQQRKTKIEDGSKVANQLTLRWEEYPLPRGVKYQKEGRKEWQDKR